MSSWPASTQQNPRSRSRGLTTPVSFSMLLVLVAVIGLALQAAAQERTFTFEGSGWGHGVGMGQWGALGQALEDPGKRGEDIAAYYYTGSRPADLSDLDLPSDLLTTLDNPLWINIASEITLLEFTAVGGPLELCLADDGEGPCPKPEQPQDGERWQFRRIDAGECGFFKAGELQGTAGDCRASISWPEADGVQLRYGEDRSKPCVVRDSECEYRHGAIKLRDDPVEVGFHVLLTIGLEDYVRGIAEIFPFWKAPGVNEAQAVAARTYAAFKFLAQEVNDRPADPDGDPGISASRKNSCWCHLYDNTRDQVYAGWWRENGPDQAAWVDAVAATEGRVLTYFGQGWERFTRGGVIQAFYSTSTGGVTNSNRHGFFTEWDDRSVSVTQWPYLLPVEDPWDLDPSLDNPVASWRTTVPASEIADRLGWDEVTDARLVSGPTTTSPSRVQFDGRDGGSEVSTTVAGAWLRYGLGLRSSVVRAIDDRPAPPTEEPVTPGEGLDGEGQAPEQGEIQYDELPPFQDIAGHIHEPGIAALRRAAVAEGCDHYSLYFCPNDPAKRLDAAIVLARAARLPRPEAPYRLNFEDVPDSFPHSREVYALAEAGITAGCAANRFCPDKPLTRGEMATFLMRALDLAPLDSFGGRRFDDVPASSIHSGAIHAIAAEGITVGCSKTSFCPRRPLTRGEMATLLARAFYGDSLTSSGGNE
ncbi:MAG: hypothetical protein F4X18_02050 [Acidimicrobiia bacterium]|nr:hypothetical protein [Acidimicrobiia bacterium]